MLVDPATLQPPPEPGFHKHDGFFMRGLVGIGAGAMRGDVATGELRVSGRGLVEAFAFGYALQENVILYGEYSVDAMFSATESGPGKNPNATEVVPIVLTFAPGMAYYIQPHNLYLAGAFGLAFTMADERLSESTSTYAKHQSQAGIGGNVLLGKEWWVSANWALGGALRAAFARAKEKTTDYPWLSYSAAVLFSATYN
jgi:hypothetical protein